MSPLRATTATGTPEGVIRPRTSVTSDEVDGAVDGGPTISAGRRLTGGAGPDVVVDSATGPAGVEHAANDTTMTSATAGIDDRKE